MNTDQPVLEGSRVRLEPLAEEHLSRSMEWVNDPFIMSGVLRVLPVSWEDQQRWFAALQADPGRMVWALVQTRGNRHVGNTGLYHLDRDHSRAEFWIYLGAPESRGLGVASQALGLVKAFAFGPLGLRRLYLHVDVDNRPAFGLYTRHGFFCEGVLRQHYFIDGKWIDVAVMSLLKHEYDQAQQP